MPTNYPVSNHNDNAASGAAKPQDVRNPVAISVREFCRLSSLGRTSTFKLIREGQLECRRIGSRTVILMRSVEALLDLSSDAS